MSRHLRHVPRRLAPREWVVSVGSAALAIAAVVIGTDLGKFHGPALHSRIIAWLSALVLAVAGTIAIRRLSTGLSHLITLRSHVGAAAIVRFVMSGVGFLILLFALFGVLGVSLQHLLIGAGVTGIVLGSPPSRASATSLPPWSSCSRDPSSSATGSACARATSAPSTPW